MFPRMLLDPKALVSPPSPLYGVITSLPPVYLASGVALLLSLIRIRSPGVLLVKRACAPGGDLLFEFFGADMSLEGAATNDPWLLVL